MNNKISGETRIQCRDWLREQLKALEFYQRRGDHFLIREFAKYCVEHNATIDEASLGRYLREEQPVVPTPERCRALAHIFGLPAVVVLTKAGHLAEGDDHVRSDLEWKLWRAGHRDEPEEPEEEGEGNP